MDKIYQKLFFGVKNAGFTLIELLVVVLIIGILASVAVPKYQKAVATAKLSGFVQQAYALRNALRMYQLANGEPVSQLSDLDIWTGPVTGTENQKGYIGKQEFANVGLNYIRTWISLPGYNTFTCDFQWNGRNGFCYVNEEKGEKLVQSMGWEKYSDSEFRPYYIGRKTDWN